MTLETSWNKELPRSGLLLDSTAGTTRRECCGKVRAAFDELAGGRGRDGGDDALAAVLVGDVATAQKKQ